MSAGGAAAFRSRLLVAGQRPFANRRFATLGGLSALPKADTEFAPIADV
jgi:hypothetical protein